MPERTPEMEAYLEARLAFSDRPRARIRVIGPNEVGRSLVEISETLTDRLLQFTYRVPRGPGQVYACARVAGDARRKFALGISGHNPSDVLTTQAVLAETTRHLRACGR